MNEITKTDETEKNIDEARERRNESIHELKELAVDAGNEVTHIIQEQADIISGRSGQIKHKVDDAFARGKEAIKRAVDKSS